MPALESAIEPGFRPIGENPRSPEEALGSAASHSRMDEARTFEDLAWLRRLARRLVRDAARADDAVQETLLAARRERGPRSRGWLAAVLRNTLRQGARADARRGARERARPQRGAAPAPDDLLAELELHQRLAGHVQALDEPYRETLLLRFLREWSPRRIAAHQGVPVKTVHTRIERGLTRLRARLDRAAPREEWLGAMALLVHPRAALPVSLTSAGAGALVVTMKTKLAVAAALAIAALGALPFLLDAGSAQLEPRSASRSTAAAEELDAPSVGRSEERVAHASAETAPPADAADESPTSAPPEPVRGLVVDTAGRPVSGVEVGFEPRARQSFAAPLGHARAWSGQDGSFAVDPPGVAGRFTVLGGAWAAVHRPYLMYGTGTLDGRDVIMVVSPGRTYAGHVRTNDGDPVADAEVRIGLADSYYTPVPAAGSVIPVRSTVAKTTTDADGAFRFESVGHMEGAWIDASTYGFEEVRRALPSASDLSLELVLDERTEFPRDLSGRVVGTSGVGVHGALVSLGLGCITTDREGRFRIDSSADIGEVRVRAFHATEGYGETRLEGEALRAASAGEEVRVLLGGPPRNVRGRVVDADGAPVPFARVWTPDTTYFGSAYTNGDRRMTANATLEALASGEEGPWGRTLEVEADADGAFVLRGLAPRDYHVFAADRATLRMSGAVVLGGTQETLEIVVDEAAEARPIAGRVVTTDGRPLAGLEVTVHREIAWERPFRRNDPWGGSPLRAPDASIGTEHGAVRTDADGRFAFDAIVIDGAVLRVPNDRAFYPPEVPLDEVADPMEIEVVTRERATVRIRTRADADSLQIVTREGEYQPVFVQVEQSRLSTRNVRLHGGRSVPLFTGSGPATVVLQRDGEVLERIDVVLEGGLNDLDL